MHTHIRSNDHILLHTKGPFFIKTSKQYNEISDTVRSLSSLQLKNKHIVKYLCVPRPPEFYTIGSKRGNTLHTQIRIEISQINSHLFKLQLPESPACHCGSDTKSARHFISSCPLYTNQRNQLLRTKSNPTL